MPRQKHSDGWWKGQPEAVAAVVADAKRAFEKAAETNRVLEQTADEGTPTPDPWTVAGELLCELAGATLPAFAAAPVWTDKKGGGR